MTFTVPYYPPDRVLHKRTRALCECLRGGTDQMFLFLATMPLRTSAPLPPHCKGVNANHKPMPFQPISQLNHHKAVRCLEETEENFQFEFFELKKVQMTSDRNKRTDLKRETSINEAEPITRGKMDIRTMTLTRAWVKLKQAEMRWPHWGASG